MISPRSFLLSDCWYLKFQAETSGAAISNLAEKVSKSDSKSTVVYKPLAKVVSRATVSALANLVIHICNLIETFFFQINVSFIIIRTICSNYDFLFNKVQRHGLGHCLNTEDNPFSFTRETSILASNKHSHQLGLVWFYVQTVINPIKHNSSQTFTRKVDHVLRQARLQNQ